MISTFSVENKSSVYYSIKELQPRGKASGNSLIKKGKKGDSIRAGLCH